MRHRHKGKTLDRAKQPRELMLRNLAASVVLYEHVTTTKGRGQAVRSLVDQVIRTGRGKDINARRALLKILPVRSAVSKVIDDLGPRYMERRGGYTRLTHLPKRQGDAADMVRIELI